MNALDWYKKVVLKDYATFTGRATRSEYWYFALINFLISIVLNIIGAAMNFPFLGTIYALAVLVPGIAAGVRRMHDVGKSGWYLLIPIYNLVLACTETQAGPNKWGPNPFDDETFDFEKTSAQ